jgi:protocatechuate 3,4-dioxygenase beta subunit
VSPHDHLMTRRGSLALLGSGGLVLAGADRISSAFAVTTDGDDYLANAAGACTLTAEQEEGPYYVAVDDVREDIVLGQPGVPFHIEITVINSLTCKPLKNAAVDLWHCNASGIYSDESSESTLGQTYLRGVQFTDKHGQVTFHSVFPGHYAGRTTHVHARIHINSRDAAHELTAGHVCHTGQVFPTEAAYIEIYKLAPYNAETATIVTHAEDRVWTEQHGYTEQMTMSMIGSRLSTGVIGKVTMAVNPKATPALIGATSSGTSGTSPGGTGPGTPPAS